LHHLPQLPIPVVLTAGGAESAEFHRQLAAYGLRLQAAGFPVRQVRLADGHHLDVISKLADKDNELAQALVALIRA
jgi:arylformamidase